MKWPWRKTAPEPAPVEDLSAVPAVLESTRKRIEAAVNAADARLDSLLERLKKLEEETP